MPRGHVLQYALTFLQLQHERGRNIRATVMYAAGDVRIENVPDARLHLRQRSLALQNLGAHRHRPSDGARSHTEGRSQ